MNRAGVNTASGTASSFAPRAEPSVQKPRLNAQTPLFIVINAGSGSGDADQARHQIADVLRASGRQHHFLPVSDPRRLDAECRRAAQIAQRYEGAVIVAGGDGTINAGINAALPTGRPFGIIPLGTFNCTGRSHEIPLDPVSAAGALLSAQVTPQQVGRVNDRCFLVNASVGLYPEILQDREAWKQRFGRYRAVAAWSAITTLWNSQQRLVLELRHGDAREVAHTSTLFVGNNADQLEQVGVAESDDVERDHLAAVVIKPVATPKLFWLALQGALGKLGEDENVRSFAFRRLTVRPQYQPWRMIKVAVDGEIRWMKPPLVFSVSAQPLMLMTPARSEAPAVAA
jgi:diacylglycerol kinase family enzyme